MSRLSRFAGSAEDPSAGENGNDHRIKMYKELRRVGPPAFHRTDASVRDEVRSAPPASKAPSHAGLDPNSAVDP